MTNDIKQTINFSNAIRRAEPDWTDDKVKAAANFVMLYMDIRLDPYEVKNKLVEFDKDSRFLY